MAELNTQIGKTPMDPKRHEGATNSQEAIRSNSNHVSNINSDSKSQGTSYTPNVTPGLGIDLEAPIPYDPNEKTNKLRCIGADI
jgi:hypothetical protein